MNKKDNLIKWFVSLDDKTIFTAILVILSLVIYTIVMAKLYVYFILLIGTTITGAIHKLLK